MKRKIIITSAALLVAAASALALASVRPQLMPEWARFGGDAQAPSEDAGLYCKEHGVPEKFCTLCHEDLKETLLLCKEHGDIPEDICTLCHPEVEKKYNIEMCPKGHGLPREFCVDCGKVPSASLGLPDDGWCSAHDKPEAACEECVEARASGKPLPLAKLASFGPDRACRDPLPAVRLASAKLARKVGIETATVAEEEHAHRLVANAETAYDANHYADISPRVSGFIREVKVDLGHVVRRGQTLAVIDSAEVGAAKAQYLSSQAALKLARVTSDRIQTLSRAGAVPGRSELEVMTALNQAEAATMDAEQRLRNLGFDDAKLLGILESKDIKNTLDVVSPIDGTVVVRHAVHGESVQATSQIFAVADTSRAWLWVDVYESDIAKIRPGQAVSFLVSGGKPGDSEATEGAVTWVGTEVDERTRTARIRAELPNSGGRLRANQYGEATIRVGDEHKAVVVPRQAVQRKDNVDVVFLPEGEGAYRPQRVTTRPTDRADVVEVTWGLRPGQVVVTRGAFLLKTEIMKGSIGAGCCE